jgi:hypothetical protein
MRNCTGIGGEFWRRTQGLNRAFPANQPGEVYRFALAIGTFPMLETARIGGNVWFPVGV